jgi:transcription elongation factor GreA-like protein/transcription elongation GreA/GreB family factor
MSYLEEFKHQIQQRDFTKLLLLWEEYCANDVVDVDEFAELLKMLRDSDIAAAFGKHAEKGLTLWKLVEEPQEVYNILKLIIDLQNVNNAEFADLAYGALKQRYAHDPHFNERLRLIGLRNRQNFQGAISNYELLAHMKKGHYVFHTGGWDAGQIVDVSLVREQLAVEFEFVAGHKHFTFNNAFKTLEPLPDTHFFSRRFANADLLEQQARENPVEIIRILLRDLGPQTAAEIKEELCELVIPEKDWTKWWQGARAKLKKDPLIETPESIKHPFRLRKAEISSQELLQRALKVSDNPATLIQQCYSLTRDMPSLMSDQAIKKQLRETMLALIAEPGLEPALEMEISIFFNQVLNEELENKSITSLIHKYGVSDAFINSIDILAYRKQALVAIREHREDWIERFLTLLLTIQSNPLRDYILKELNESEAKAALSDTINELLQAPMSNPEVFLWYFQKLVCKEGKGLPFSDKKSLEIFFESFLILYNQLENKPEYRDLLKKTYTLLSGQRFALVRQILEHSDLEFAKEYLLLVSKCQSLSDHDLKILRSLAEVVHPSLGIRKKHKSHQLTDGHIVWTTQEGFLKAKQQLQHLGTDIVENAREIEVARSHGDLRENAEYKFALERNLKHLSEQLNRVRVLTQEDFTASEIGVGSVATLLHKLRNETLTYTILGPWDADPENGILSFQSQFAQGLIGLKENDSYRFRDDEYTITGVTNVFEK